MLGLVGPANHSVPTAGQPAVIWPPSSRGDDGAPGTTRPTTAVATACSAMPWVLSACVGSHPPDAVSESLRSGLPVSVPAALRAMEEIGSVGSSLLAGGLGAF